MSKSKFRIIRIINTDLTYFRIVGYSPQFVSAPALASLFVNYDKASQAIQFFNLNNCYVERVKKKMLSKVSKAKFIREATKNGLIFMGVLKHQSLESLDASLDQATAHGERSKVVQKSTYRIARITYDGESELCIKGASDTVYEHSNGFWVVYTSIDDERFRQALIYGK